MHGISREELHYSTVGLFRNGCFEKEIEIEVIKIVMRACVHVRVFFLRVKCCFCQGEVVLFRS